MMNKRTKWTEGTVGIFMNILTISAIIVLIILISKNSLSNFLAFLVSGNIQKCCRKKKQSESFSNEVRFSS